MARKSRRFDARTADATDLEAVVALLLADDPTSDDNAELRRLLRANAKITAPVAEVGGYPRISEYRPERDADGSIGVLRQAKKILRHANERQVRVIRWYLDNDFSAANPNVKRPSYLALLDDLRAGRVGGLLALDLTRLYRQSKEFCELVEVYDSFPRGARPYIATTDGQLDLSTEIGRFVAELLVLVGKLESANISKRIRDKIDAKFTEGAWQGGTIPYGYRHAGTGRLDVEPAEAEVVAEMARLVLEGWNLTRVVRHLNASGAPPRRGSYWRTTTIRAMLLNPLYAGYRTHQPRKPHSFEPDGDQRRVATEMWPAILTDDVMARLKAILTADGRRTTGPRGGAVRTYLGSGILKCGVCGGHQVRGKPGGKDGHGRPMAARYQCIDNLCSSRDAAGVDAWLRAFVVEAARGEPDLLADAFAPDDTPGAGQAETLARLTVVQAELAKDPATVVSECGLTFDTYASLRRGLETEEKVLLASLVPAGRPRPVLPPVAELEALVADPASLAVVHDLITTYLDGYGFEIVMHRVGRGSHNRRNAPGLSDEERAALWGLEVRRQAEAAAAAA